MPFDHIDARMVAQYPHYLDFGRQPMEVLLHCIGFDLNRDSEMPRQRTVQITLVNVGFAFLNKNSHRFRVLY